MNAYYRLYILSVIKLVATLVIKSKYTAAAINARLVSLGNFVDPDDPYSWKYYQNLAGEYHTANEAALLSEFGYARMQITSLDTQETIDFTKANLLIHRATRKEYTYGNRYYDDLKAKYPAQEMLINGIINPIDIETAISANDHTILSYDTSLVEPAEQQLPGQLQKYISLYFNRYDNPDYGLFEPFYYPALLAGLYSKMILEVLMIRLRACKTDQAHSYHIRQYLISNSAIGAEFDYMTQKQKLAFYRDILYLNRNIGRQETFEWLTQKVLTDRGFSLAGYTIGQTYENLATNLKPHVVMDRETINGIAAAAGADRKTVGEVLDMELPLARDNPIVRDVTEVNTNQAMSLSLWSQLPTKVLESNVIDRSDAEPFTLTEVLLNHWIYLSHYGRFQSVIPITNPSNGDVFRLSVKNAFIFYLYAYNKANDVELITVPVIAAKRVRRIPHPTFEELRAMNSEGLPSDLQYPIKKVPDYYLHYILDTQATIGTYISIEAFREACQEIQSVMLRQREMRHYNGDYKAEGALHSIIDRCYMDIRIDLAEGIDYDLWLKDVGIDTSAMGRLEYAQIATDIFKTATGADVTNASAVREIHAAMLRIMRSLSSYSVQYIAQINDSPIKVLDGKFPKLGIPEQLTTQHFDFEIQYPDILDIAAYEREFFDVTMLRPSVKMGAKEETAVMKVPACMPIKLVGVGDHLAPIPITPPIASLKRPALTDLADYTQADEAGYLPIPPQSISDLIISSELSGYELLTDARRKTMLHI